MTFIPYTFGYLLIGLILVGTEIRFNSPGGYLRTKAERVRSCQIESNEGKLCMVFLWPFFLFFMYPFYIVQIAACALFFSKPIQFFFNGFKLK